MQVFEYQGLKIGWLGHDGFKIKNGKTVIVDPFKVRSSSDKADLLLISHEHYDNLSTEDIKKVSFDKTIVVAAVSCKNELSKLKLRDVRFIDSGGKLNVDGVILEAVPAYNLNKFREPGKVFHPKDEGKVGYIIEIEGVRVYHAGDTDAIPEMKNFRADIALLPVSGTYVMNAQEAASAVGMIRPKLAIPMHYGAIVGSESDAQKFKQIAPCDVQILKPE